MHGETFHSWRRRETFKVCKGGPCKTKSPKILFEYAWHCLVSVNIYKSLLLAGMLQSGRKGTRSGMAH